MSGEEDVETQLTDVLKSAKKIVTRNKKLEARVSELEEIAYNMSGNDALIGASKDGLALSPSNKKLKALELENTNLKLRLGLLDLTDRQISTPKQQLANSTSNDNDEGPKYITTYQRRKSARGSGELEKQELVPHAEKLEDGQPKKLTMKDIEKQRQIAKRKKKNHVTSKQSGVWCWCCKGAGIRLFAKSSKIGHLSPNGKGNNNNNNNKKNNRPTMSHSSGASGSQMLLDGSLAADERSTALNSSRSQKQASRSTQQAKNKTIQEKNSVEHEYTWMSYEVEFGPGALGMKLNIHPDAIGCFVHHVEPDSQAEKAKVTVNEKISHVGTVAVKDAHEAMAELKRQSRPIRLTFMRATVKPTRPIGLERRNSYRGDVIIPEMEKIMAQEKKRRDSSNENGGKNGKNEKNEKNEKDGNRDNNNSSDNDNGAGSKTGSPRLGKNEATPTKNNSALVIPNASSKVSPQQREGTLDDGQGIHMSSNNDTKSNNNNNAMQANNEDQLDSTLDVLLRRQAASTNNNVSEDSSSSESSADEEVVQKSSKQRKKQPSKRRRRQEKGAISSGSDSSISSDSSDSSDEETSKRRSRAKKVKKEKLKAIKMKQKKRNKKKAAKKLVKSVPKVNASKFKLAPSPSKRMTWKEKMELRKQQTFDDEEEDV